MEELQATAAWYAGPDERVGACPMVVSFWRSGPWRQYVAAVDAPGRDVEADADAALAALGAARVGEWSRVELHSFLPAADDSRRAVNTSMTCRVRVVETDGTARDVAGVRVIAPARARGVAG